MLGFLRQKQAQKTAGNNLGIIFHLQFQLRWEAAVVLEWPHLLLRYFNVI